MLKHCPDISVQKGGRTQLEFSKEKKKKSLEGVSDLHTKLWGHVASARKRSHQWCLTLTPKNTETILKNEMSLFSATNQERPYKQLLHD